MTRRVNDRGQVVHSTEEQNSPSESAAADQRYSTELGAIFTKRWVAELVLDLAGYTSDEPLYARTVLEPSCGHGAFIEVIVERLLESCRRDEVELSNARTAVMAMDVDIAAVQATRSIVTQQLVDAGLAIQTAAQLADHWVCHGDFLKSAESLPMVDWVVGNPPYVRIEDVSRIDMETYRSTWTTMSGRADLYVGFFEAGLSRLSTGGRLSYICADRWMRNRYGAGLRDLVERDFAVETCVVMHAVDAFEDRVAAYPAVTVIKSGPQRDALAVDAADNFDAEAASRLLRIQARGPAPVAVDAAFRASWLSSWPSGGGSWPAGSPEQLRLLAALEDRFPTLAETGAFVAVGIATGADDIYVVDDPSVVEQAMSAPTLAARETSLGGIDWLERHLVIPWTTDGLADLNDYPKLHRYLLKHKKRLDERHIAKRNPDRWWRTIDRIDPTVAEKPKLLIPDLKDRIHPVLDQGKFVPLHSLYYVTSDTWDLAVLGGLLMSRVANMFVEAYSVRMANGYLRVSAQYLRRVRVPKPGDVSSALADDLRTAFWSRDEEAATAAARAAYGLPAQT